MAGPGSVWEPWGGQAVVAGLGLVSGSRPRRGGAMAAIGYEDEAAGVRYVSTGHLPAVEDVQRAVEEAYQRYRELPDGRVAQVYPALARVPAGMFGICVAGTSGRGMILTERRVDIRGHDISCCLG